MTAFPHQLSGGMAQRVAIAAARAGGAGIVIADEPTKGLDASRRDDVASLLLNEMAQTGGLLVITHDLELARQLGGDIIVLQNGAIVETGETHAVLTQPEKAFTKAFLAADPKQWPPFQPPRDTAEILVETQSLGLRRGNKRLFGDVTLTLHPGKILGITGPSGCGKSSLGDALLGLLPPDQGTILRHLSGNRTALQKLYQDPVSAFPRRQTLRRSFEDVRHKHRAAEAEMTRLMRLLSLDPALLSRRPGEVSGGELQRFAILRVLLVRPKVIFADEPTSRLDPITQQQVISLLVTVTRESGCALVLVSHDRDLIAKTADETLEINWTSCH